MAFQKVIVLSNILNVEIKNVYPIAYNGRQLGEVAEGLACSVAAIATNCG